MNYKNIFIALFTINTFITSFECSAQMPAGMEPIFKPISYNYQGWRIKRGEKIKMGDSSEALVKNLELYKINGWEKMYLRLQKADGAIVEGELESLLKAGTIVSPFKIDIIDPSNSSGNKTLAEIELDPKDIYRELGYAGSELRAYSNMSAIADVTAYAGVCAASVGALLVANGNEEIGLATVAIGAIGAFAGQIIRSVAAGHIGNAGKYLQRAGSIRK